MRVAMCCAPKPARTACPVALALGGLVWVGGCRAHNASVQLGGGVQQPDTVKHRPDTYTVGTVFDTVVYTVLRNRDEGHPHMMPPCGLHWPLTARWQPQQRQPPAHSGSGCCFEGLCPAARKSCNGGAHSHTRAQ